MFCSLGYRLRSRVALGIGIVVIMYCKFLMEYVYKKKSTKHRIQKHPTLVNNVVLFLDIQLHCLLVQLHANIYQLN